MATTQTMPTSMIMCKQTHMANCKLKYLVQSGFNKYSFEYCSASIK